DRSFIADIPGNKEDEAIAIAIIQLARAMHLVVTAEGVETEAQRDFLLGQGCTEMQGFLVAPALPAEELFQRFGPCSASRSADAAISRPRSTTVGGCRAGLRTHRPAVVANR